MYINFWYVAAQSGEVPAGAERPLKVQILGHRSALWRDQSGKVRCISDTCSHRDGALADGRIRGDCIECPYHGRTFNGDGVGDLPEAERRPVIDIPEFDDPAWRFIVMKLDWIYVMFGRNFLADAKHDQTFENRGAFVAEPDRYVPEPVRPNLNAHHRESCQEWEARGWGIDVAKMRADCDTAAYAIPSPARRKARAGSCRPCRWWPRWWPWLKPARPDPAAAFCRGGTSRAGLV